MNFATYYTIRFRQDINQFFSTIPDQSLFHEDNQNKQTLSIQYERLTKDFDHLNFLSKTEKEYFGIALFFTVLSDMVCYSHYKNHYQKFKELTRYPKFIGNCPGGCQYHHPPSNIFYAMNFSRTKPLELLSSERLEFYEKFIEAMPTIEKETKDFFTKYLAEIDGQEFWGKCKSDFPYTLKIDY
jgi:hypothetical protein